LLAVSCASTKACFAVGNSWAMGYGPFAERWDGSKWSVPPTHFHPWPGDNTVAGVSCASPSSCVTVGGRNPNQNMVGRWNGRTWSIRLLSSSPALPVNLGGVSCPSMTVCTAVGGYPGGSYFPGVTDPAFSPGTYAQRWNGTSWSIQQTANPTGAGRGLAAVSCPTRTVCAAVGDYRDPTGKTHVLIERWHGTG
jgi:hypothetical protein